MKFLLDSPSRINKIIAVEFCAQFNLFKMAKNVALLERFILIDYDRVTSFTIDLIIKQNKISLPKSNVNCR